MNKMRREAPNCVNDSSSDMASQRSCGALYFFVYQNLNRWIIKIYPNCHFCIYPYKETYNFGKSKGAYTVVPFCMYPIKITYTKMAVLVF